MKLSLVIFSFLLWTNFAFGQDTIKLMRKPKVVIKSWYPEHKDFPSFRVGKSKVVITLTPDLDKTLLRHCFIDLRTSTVEIEIKETDKIFPSQFVVSVKPTKKKYAIFEAWLLLEDRIVLIFQNGRWTNIKNLCRVEGNKVLIDTIKLKIEQ